MSMTTQLDAPLRSLHTFACEVRAAALTEIRTLADYDRPDLRELLQQPDTLILGGGSNVLFVRKPEGPVVRVAHQYESIDFEDENGVLLRVAAGVSWPELVARCTKKGWFGIENLALIPGTVGAAPLQNIGAYGVELKEVLDCVYARDRQNGKEVQLTNTACHFGYRTSHFKTKWRGQLVVESLVLRLSKHPKVNLSYAALQQAFADRRPETVTPLEVFEAVCRIRRSKLPTPGEVGSAGSFFQNPIVDTALFERVRTTEPEAVAYPQPDGSFKLAAGWLIEKAGFRGIRRGDAGTWPQQALVLVNYGTATGTEIWQLAQDIQAAVEARFGISLAPEVQIYE